MKKNASKQFNEQLRYTHCINQLTRRPNVDFRHNGQKQQVRRVRKS